MHDADCMSLLHLDECSPPCCRDGVVLACEILDCCPWFEFADLDTYVSDEEGDGVSTAPDSAVGTDDSGLDDASRCGLLEEFPGFGLSARGKWKEVGMAEEAYAHSCKDCCSYHAWHILQGEAAPFHGR